MHEVHEQPLKIQAIGSISAADQVEHSSRSSESKSGWPEQAFVSDEVHCVQRLEVVGESTNARHSDREMFLGEQPVAPNRRDLNFFCMQIVVRRDPKLRYLYKC